ncbi:ABC transporter ATP-binding protein [Anaerobacillus sp. CMMVII]|uniref:ABC transporter ATP-binding protein n=1 Tax=Anaerobacillus sp. CMMVII TaxID=2755588 RepID=UPI0021B813A3|nr:ABC transporter ATP-binding protein [Anaerobacillus sp. CMMVII]MCT8138520.1 ABC transporter ATP-binding protein [Anaerobacillus sp. CMMVII]
MAIVINHLSKEYKTSTEKILVLNGITLTIKNGTWITIVGPSGSGKSTLLKCIGGIEKLDEGSEIIFDDWHLEKAKGDDIPEFRRNKIGFVFQDYRLFDQFTVLDNVMMPMVPYENKLVLQKKAEELLTQFGLHHRRHYFPTQLSGGEKQRTAIARALINSPKLLICDEPTGNLDQKNRDAVLNTLKELHQKGHSILLVTHDQEITFLGDETYRLTEGQLERVKREDMGIKM